MSRRLLVISVALVVVGLVALVYADPLARLSFGGVPGGGGFPASNTTRTFTFNNRTVTGGPGGFSGGFVGRGSNSFASIETLVAVALVAVGLVLEVIVILLWQGKTPDTPTQPGQASPP